MSNKNIIIDDGFKTLLVPLKPDELQLLEEQLIEQGCREPLIVWPQVGGPSIIIDGHNRHAICTRRGIKFDVRHVPFESRQAAETWIVKNQLGRRNLNPAERSSLAIRLKPSIAAEAQARMLKGKADPTQKSAEGIETRQVLAEIAGVSRDTIAKVEFIEANGIPELREATRTGKLSINKAADIAREPKTEQLGILAIRFPSKARRPAKPKPQTPTTAEIKVVGVGVARANEALNCLTRIPKDDALRRRGFQIVADWIRHNAPAATATTSRRNSKTITVTLDSTQGAADLWNAIPPKVLLGITSELARRQGIAHERHLAAERERRQLDKRPGQLARLSAWVDELNRYVSKHSITGLYQIAARGREILDRRPSGQK
jgi:hypothetical protein